MMKTTGFKISFCTVCMNRLHHLKETLPENIRSNLDYAQLEFVLLDYNGQDGLESWIRSEFAEALATGRLKYFKNPVPESFNMAHSRNMVAHLATGDIICLIDADNYTGPGFAAYVNSAFKKNASIFLTAIARGTVKNPSDVLGRICVMKTDFARITGFDEFMTSYGFEDYDLANRLQISGLKRKVIAPQQYLRAISHPKEERTRHMALKKIFHRLFIHQVSPSSSEVLFLFSDFTLSIGTIVNDHTRFRMSLQRLATDRQIKYEDRITTDDWVKGTWTEAQGALILINGNETEPVTLKMTDDGKYLRHEDEFFAVPPHSYLVDDLILFHSIISNRNRMLANLKRKIVSPNLQGFGRGIVYKNFDDEQPIHTGIM